MTDTQELKPLTERQRQVLDFIVDFSERHGYRASVREVQQFLQLASPNGAMCHLIPLRKKGYITWEQNTARSIRPVEVSNASA